MKKNKNLNRSQFDISGLFHERVRNNVSDKTRAVLFHQDMIGDLLKDKNLSY